MWQHSQNLFSWHAWAGMEAKVHRRLNIYFGQCCWRWVIIVQKFVRSELLFNVSVAIVYNGLYEKVKLVLMHLLQWYLVEQSESLLSAFRVHSLRWGKDGWYLGSMEACNKALCVWQRESCLQRKWPCDSATLQKRPPFSQGSVERDEDQVFQSLNVLSTCEGHTKKQIHLSGWLTCTSQVYSL